MATRDEPVNPRKLGDPLKIPPEVLAMATRVMQARRERALGLKRRAKARPSRQNDPTRYWARNPAKLPALKAYETRQTAIARVNRWRADPANWARWLAGQRERRAEFQRSK